MGTTIVIIVAIVLALAVSSFLWSMLAAVLRARRRIRRVAEHDARQQTKSIEQRIAERGLTEVAQRHPQAARMLVMTDAEREAERREQESGR